MTSTSARHSPAGATLPRHASHLRRVSVLRAVSLTLVGALTFVTVGLASAATRLQGNIDKVEITGLLGTDRPTPKAKDPDDPNSGHAMNIVLLGSDDRGDGEVVGDGVEGMRSDTTIVLHISADRSRVELVSIPRDSMVDIPSCTMTDGSETAARYGMFNSAFATGWDNGQDLASAAGCTVKTIESLTGVYIDGYFIVDFAGFETMVNALGGVTMCIPEDVDAPKADNLVLTAGVQTLDGTQALSYARARTGTGLGDGSDTTRIGRQQEMLSAMVREVFEQNLLTDLPALYQFVDAATKSLTANPELASATSLSGLAFSMRGVRSNNITFLTIPWAHPANKNRVVWTSEAAQIWANIADDVPAVTVAEPEPTTEPTAAATGEETTEQPDDGTAAEPTPTETKQAGREPFTPDDTTSVCG
ncbi:MAG: LCP family protein [Cellulomonadaceae bacterium]